MENKANNIAEYTPTNYVDYSEPDIDAEHLNKTEQALMRVTAAANEAMEALKQLNLAKLDTSKIVNSLLASDPTTVLSGALGPIIDQRLTDLLNKYTQLNGELSLFNIKNIAFRSTFSTGWILHISIQTVDDQSFTVGFDKDHGIYVYNGADLIWHISS